MARTRIYSNRLYIPHGSDESNILKMITERDPILYIPHGSDESKSHLNSFLQFLRLYIPHGSDESIVGSGDEKHLQALYPTWFR